MLSAAILAGGQARRFGGADKSALIVEGRSILDRQLDALREIAGDIMLVEGADNARRRSAPGPIRVIHDRLPDRGPLGGLDAALAAARAPVVLVVACDMPFVTAPFLQHLASSVREADAAVPRTARGYHPVCAAYTTGCRATVLRMLAGDRSSMMALLDELHVREVGEDEIEMFGPSLRLLANVNTPEELARTEAFAAHHS
jgi:molybdopterin-guanine dinucleotide biosynthesis protein A